MTNTSPGAAIAASRTRGYHWKATLSGLAGNTLELYDFLLYGAAASLFFPTLFFPGESPFAATLCSYVVSTLVVQARDGAPALRAGTSLQLHGLAGAREQRPYAYTAAVHAQGIEGKGEAAQKGLGTRQREIAAARRRVQTGRAGQLHRVPGRLGKAQRRIRVNQELPVHELHTGHPETVQSTGNPGCL